MLLPWRRSTIIFSICIRNTAQKYPCRLNLWHPKDTRESAEVYLHAACVHVWLPRCGLSVWDSEGLPLTREPGGHCLFFPVHSFQVSTVLCIFTSRLTAFIFVVSPLPVSFLHSSTSSSCRYWRNVSRPFWMGRRKSWQMKRFAMLCEVTMRWALCFVLCKVFIVCLLMQVQGK